MIFKNVAGQGIYVYAFDVTTGLPKTGDAANITATISKDGAAAAPIGTANPTEIGAGLYWYPLTQAETNAGQFTVAPSSSTASIQLDPAIVTTEGGFVPNLDAAVSSRSSHGDPDPTNLIPNLDAAVSSRSAHADPAPALSAEHVVLQNEHAALSAEHGAIPAATLAEVVEAQGGYTLQQTMSLLLAVLAGRTTGGGLTFKTPDGVATRLVVTVNPATNERLTSAPTP